MPFTARKSDGKSRISKDKAMAEFDEHATADASGAVSIVDRIGAASSVFAGQIVPTTLLRALSAGLAIGFIALFAYVAAARLFFPYPLEWLEADTVDIVGRILRSLPVYCEPNYAYVPTMKTPLYYYVVAAFSMLFGDSLATGRLVSVLSMVGVCLVIGRFIQKERAGHFWALIGAGLFLATFKISQMWYDIARLDSLYLLLLMGSVYALRFWQGPRGAVAAGLFFAATYFTKQTVLMVAIPLLLAVGYFELRRALVTALVFVGAVFAGMVMLHLTTDGWSTFFLVEVPRHGRIILSHIVSFWSADLLQPLLLAVAGAAALAPLLWREDRPAAAFYAALLGAALFCSWMGRVHAGGDKNALMPTYAVVAVMAPVAAQRLLASEWLRRWPLPSPAAALHLLVFLQLFVLIYNPKYVVPTLDDRHAADQVVAFLRNIDGDVLVMDDRYFARLGGKSNGLDYSLVDLLADGRSPIAIELRRSVIDALKSGKFVGVVDPPDFVMQSVRLGPPIPIQILAPNEEENLFKPTLQSFYALQR
jgi:Dolichyl-phosphate-mannose-protein mannosyltransferase